MSVLTLNVDEARRTLSNSDKSVFVINDKNVNIVRFALLTGFTDIVLDEHSALRVMYQRPGETEVRAQTLTYYDTDGIHNFYDWELLAADLAKKGTITCALCILRTDSEVEEWHTTPYQIRVLGSIHTDDSDEADESITPTVAQRVAVLESMIQRVASGAPIVVASTSAMTDTEQIYVLSTNGNWYYHNGTAWTVGGEYGGVAAGSITTDKLANGAVTTAKIADGAITADKLSSDIDFNVETDTTLTQAGMPADAETVGGKVNSIEASIASYPSIKDSDAEDVDLDVSDAQGNVIVRFANGHIKTKNFDSEDIDFDVDVNVDVLSQITDNDSDLYISDEQGNGLVRFANGNIQTSKFSSDNGIYKSVFTYSDVAGVEVIDQFFPKGTRLAFHLVKADVKGWGEIANYTVTYKYTDINGITRVLGSDYGYNFPVYTLPEDVVSVSVAYGTGLTYHETVDLAFCVYPEASFAKQPKVIAVSPDGSKDFTTLRDAVDSIPVDVCELNPYEIHVYPGTYDVLADYSQAEINVTGFKGLFLYNGTSLIGIGQRDEIILTATMSETDYDRTKRNDVSTINIYGNVHIENVIIKGENIRYAVHDEGSMMTHKFNVHSYKNVKFVGKNLTSGGGGINAYGAGCSSNKQIKMIGCDFTDQLGIHSQYDLLHEITIYLENCTARSFKFSDYENVNAKAHVILRNCKSSSIEISQSRDGQAQSMTFDGIGECNALIKCPAGYVYNFGCCHEFFDVTIGAGYAVKINSVLNGITVSADRGQLYGVSIGTRDGNTIVQTYGYINSNTLGITGLAVGDYLTIDGTGKVVSGGTSENAIAVVKVVDASGVAYAKLLI